MKTLIRWIGDDPKREGLLETPARVLRAYGEWFAADDPAEHLARTFEEWVATTNRSLARHPVPFLLRTPHGADHRRRPYKLPAGARVVGISKLARVVDGFARRLQIQERMTAEIAGAIDDVLQPRGVGVVIEANHACMSSRGVHKHGASMVTSRMIGVFKDDPVIRGEFLASIRQSGGTDVANSRAFT